MEHNTDTTPCDKVNNDCMTLTEEQIVSPQEEVELFWSRLPDKPTKRHTVRAVVKEWLTGCYGAEDAVEWLRILKLYSCPVSADPYETMAAIATKEFGSVARPEDHVQPPPPDLVRVTYEARQRRKAGRTV